MGNLRVGAAAVDITPHLGTCLSGHLGPRRAEDVSYPLQSKAVVFDDGERQVAYVQNDLLILTRAQFDVAKARAQELTGIPPAAIMMSCTHTHYGPATYSMFGVQAESAYLDWALARMGDAVKLAQKHLAHVQLVAVDGFAAHFSSLPTINTPTRATASAITVSVGSGGWISQTSGGVFTKNINSTAAIKVALNHQVLVIHSTPLPPDVDYE